MRRRAQPTRVNLIDCSLVGDREATRHQYDNVDLIVLADMAAVIRGIPDDEIAVRAYNAKTNTYRHTEEIE